MRLHAQEKIYSNCILFRSLIIFVKGQQDQKDNLAAGYHNDKRRIKKTVYKTKLSI